MPEQRHIMEIHGIDAPDIKTDWLLVFFPGIGEMTVTCETRPFAREASPRPVLSFHFDTDRVDIIDHRGNDKRIGKEG